MDMVMSDGAAGGPRPSSARSAASARRRHPAGSAADAPAAAPTEFHHERLELAVEATELGLWEWDIRTGEIFWSERQREIFGVAQDGPVDYETWSAALHPEDRDWVLAEVARAVDPAFGGRLQFEHRLVRPDGSVRWIFANARTLFEGSGTPRRPIRLLGTVFDITDRKRAEEERYLLVRELNHRVKNLFAVASSLVALTARSAASPEEMGDALRGRFDALGRAHELIQPMVTPQGLLDRSTHLADLARAVLAPYASGDEDRVALNGPPIPVGAPAATSLTLVLHELATNAVKYGALSAPEGRLSLTWSLDGEVVCLHWLERGGPPVRQAPTAHGFGSKLARRTVKGQLGGTLLFDWSPEGLGVMLRIPVERLRG